MAPRRGAAGAAMVGARPQAAQHLGGVGEHQAVSALGILASLEELVEEAQPLLGGQALDKGQVALAVLHAVLALFGLAGHREGDITQAALLA